MESNNDNGSYFDEQWWPWYSNDGLIGWDYFAADIHENPLSGTSYEDAQGSPQNEENGTLEPVPPAEHALENFSEIFDLFCQQNTALEPENSSSPQKEVDMPSVPSSATLCSPAPYDIVPESLKNYTSQDDEATIVHCSPGPSMVRPNVQNQIQLNSLGASPLQAQTNSGHPVNDAQGIMQVVRTQLHNVDTKASAKTGAKRRKLTPKQLENQQKVRALGACLRCYVGNCTCSEGRPCRTCQAQFAKDKNKSSLLWTKCVSSNLPDLNIFALGVHILENDKRMAGISLTTAFSMYALLFQQNITNQAIPIENLRFQLQRVFGVKASQGSHSILMDAIDALYDKVLQHRYGDRASEAHPFLLTHSNPLYTLVKLNVVLLGSPMLGPYLIGCVRYFQNVRSICAMIAFECLEKAFRRTNLLAASLDRQSSLIIQIALLLDQVIEVSHTLPAAALSCSHGQMFEEMRQGLIQYLTCYLHKLMPYVPTLRKFMVECVRKAEHDGHLDNEFWVALSDLLPNAQLRKPPVLRQYTEFSWDGCGVNEGEALCDYFATHCSIACM